MIDFYYLVVFAIFLILFTFLAKRKFNMRLLQPWDPNDFQGRRWLCYVMPLVITLLTVLATSVVAGAAHLLVN